MREIPKKVNARTSQVLTTLNERIGSQRVEDAAIAALDTLFETKERAFERIQDTAASTAHAIEAGVAGVTARVLDVADMIVDRALPEGAAASGENKENAAEAPAPAAAAAAAAAAASNADVASGKEPRHPKLGAQTAAVLRKARAMTSKARTRIYARAIDQIRFAQRRSHDVVELLRPFTVNLIQYAEDLIDEAEALDKDEAEWEDEIESRPASAPATASTTAPSAPLPASIAPAAEQLAQKLQAASRKVLVKALHAAIRSRRWAHEKVAVIRLRLRPAALRPAELASTASDLVASARMQVYSVTSSATKLVHDRMLALQPVIPDIAAKVSHRLRTSVDHIYSLYEDKHLVSGLLEELEGAKDTLVELLKHIPLGGSLILNKNAPKAEQVVAVNTGSGNIEVFTAHDVSALASSGDDEAAGTRSEASEEADEEAQDEALPADEQEQEDSEEPTPAEEEY